MSRAFWLGVVASLVPSFVIAYPWHLVVFSPTYRELAMHRDDVLVPFGLLSMLTGFTLLQFVVVGPLIALAHRR